MAGFQMSTEETDNVVLKISVDDSADSSPGHFRMPHERSFVHVVSFRLDSGQRTPFDRLLSAAEQGAAAR
jgi:hypothetical protein